MRVRRLRLTVLTVLVLGVLLPAFAASPGKSEARPLMDALTAGGAPGRDALDQIVRTRDVSYVGVLIELLRASQAGIARDLDDGAIVAALRRLTGLAYGDDWIAWVEWYGGTSNTPPP